MRLKPVNLEVLINNRANWAGAVWRMREKKCERGRDSGKRLCEERYSAQDKAGEGQREAEHLDCASWRVGG